MFVKYINALEYKLLNSVLNKIGYKTDRKIIVFESDDWGSIRMPSREVYEKSLKKGYRVDLNPFDKYDSLENEDDLMFLFDTLSKFKDINGNHPQITANSLVANPDFDKIIKSRNTEYFIETVDNTFASYPKHKNSMNLWHEGEKKGVFCLQYHGREHFNKFMFMDALKNNKEEAIWALNNKMGGSIELIGDNKNHYVTASSFVSKEQMKEGIKMIQEGIQLFKNLHSKDSKSYIGTNYMWPIEFEKILYHEGVQYIQGMPIQRTPQSNKIFRNRIYHYLGERNLLNQIYLIRNCKFEPTSTKNSLDKCLFQIENAFKNNKPAIISTHRFNYIGNIFEENRDNNLLILKNLLSNIVKKWPDVEFMNSVQIGELIRNK